jgi:glycosyltransferase involved in cell wall biosynthesis
VSARASVVIPAYNHAAYVGEAVASVLACDAVPLELIVIDDGSTDGTADVVAGFSDPRLRLLRQENRGAHAALNRGVLEATGEVVFFLNSDDAFAPSRIERCVELLRHDLDAAAVGSALELIDERGQRLGVKHGWRDLPPWPRERGGPALAELGDPSLALLETNFLATTSNLACRRSLFERHGLRFAPLRYAHDWELMLATLHHGHLAFIEEPLVRYRVHSRNTIREGRGQGQAAMRFEILWLLARHARAILETHAVRFEARLTRTQLEQRLWRGLPRFGREEVLLHLLWAHGVSPSLHDRLLDPTHPWRRLAEHALG